MKLKNQLSRKEIYNRKLYASNACLICLGFKPAVKNVVLVGPEYCAGSYVEFYIDGCDLHYIYDGISFVILKDNKVFEV